MCIVLRKSSSDVSFWIFALDGIIYLSLNNKNSERQGIGLLEYRRNEPRVYLDRMERMLPSKMGIETNERMSSTTTAVTGGRGKKKRVLWLLGPDSGDWSRSYWVRHSRDNKGRGDRGNCCDRNGKPSVCGDRYGRGRCIACIGSVPRYGL